MDIIDVRKTEPKRVQRENEKGNRVKSDLFDYVCIIVHVAASQFTSSKLWSIVKPIVERLSKLLSPSTYLLLEDKCRKYKGSEERTQSITTALALNFRICLIASRIRPCITVE